MPYWRRARLRTRTGLLDFDRRVQDSGKKLRLLNQGGCSILGSRDLPPALGFEPFHRTRRTQDLSGLLVVGGVVIEKRHEPQDGPYYQDRKNHH